MTREELWKEAWAFPPDQKIKGECIAVITTEYDTYYFYGPDEEGIYHYESGTTRRVEKELKEAQKRRKEKERRRWKND